MTQYSTLGETQDWQPVKLLNGKGQSSEGLVDRTENKVLCLQPETPCTGSRDYLMGVLQRPLKRYFTLSVKPIIDLEGYYYLLDDVTIDLACEAV